LYLRGVDSRFTAYASLVLAFIVTVGLAVAAVHYPPALLLVFVSGQGVIGIALSIWWVERNDPWR
jgi:hypothetical protein